MQKPFNLAAAQDGEKFCDGFGDVPSQWFYFSSASNRPLVCIFDGVMRKYKHDGRFSNTGLDHVYDLVMMPVKRVWHFASWDAGLMRVTTDLYPTREQLDVYVPEFVLKHAADLRFHEIEIEE